MQLILSAIILESNLSLLNLIEDLSGTTVGGGGEQSLKGKIICFSQIVSEKRNDML